MTIFLKQWGAVLLVGSMLMACSTPAEKVTEAEQDVIEAEAALELTQEQYQQEMEDFRRINNEKIAANEKSIADLSCQIRDQGFQQRGRLVHPFFNNGKYGFVVNGLVKMTNYLLVSIILNHNIYLKIIPKDFFFFKYPVKGLEPELL